ncbi:hypothetical protein HNY73_006436 [Argiope bruennichi]|uniref:Uncharacterized protein n=1 Tax=Argiope bruennichi TaxID=94029 RepID=A0A8T0FK38_ARGBR|nr:hypothetical protein HNY73_006436 [Argiope bruennichi]
MKQGQDEMKQGQDEMNQGQDEMNQGQDEMNQGQERMEQEMKKRQERMEQERKSGKEELKKDIVSVKEEFSNIIQEKINAIEDKVASFENKVISVETKVLKMEESIDKVREDIGKEFEQKFGKETECLEKEISHEHKESKVIFTPSLATIKLSTFDEKTSWQVYKTQFTMVAEANGWNPQAKAFHLASSLRGDAADILETLTEEQRHDFHALSSALELRFGEKCTK